MPSTCFTPIKARVARVIRLDVCGDPATGSSDSIVFDGFTSISASPEYEEGEEFVVKNANGELCINEKDANALKRIGLEITFCCLDAEVIQILTGEDLIVTGGLQPNTGVRFGEGLLEARFSLEVWQPLAGQPCSAEGEEQFVYWAFPNVGNAMVSDFNFTNGPLEFTISADTRAASPNWTTVYAEDAV